MRDRTLGATGLPATSLGLGLTGPGRPGYIHLGHAEDLPASYEVATIEAGAHRAQRGASRVERTRFGN